MQWGRGVPGVGWDEGGSGGVLPGYTTRTLPGPIFSHILRLEPYPGPNEGNSERFHEVSQIWPQKGSQNGLRYGLRMTSR